jgi:Flp pilus assembly protein TadD
MSSRPLDIRALRQAGTAALQAGDASTARRCFEQVAAGGHADASVWIALAVA